MNDGKIIPIEELVNRILQMQRDTDKKSKIAEINEDEKEIEYWHGYNMALDECINRLYDAQWNEMHVEIDKGTIIDNMEDENISVHKLLLFILRNYDK